MSELRDDLKGSRGSIDGFSNQVDECRRSVAKESRALADVHDSSGFEPHESCAGYLILPFTYTLFTLFYALYGSILYVVGPFVLALIPSRGLGQLGRTYFVNMMIFQCWGLLCAILQSLMSALQITNPLQFNGSFLQAFVGSSQVIVMSVASVLIAIMVALIPFIASRIVRGDIGGTLMTVISGAM